MFCNKIKVFSAPGELKVNMLKVQVTNHRSVFHIPTIICQERYCVSQLSVYLNYEE